MFVNRVTGHYKVNREVVSYFDIDINFSCILRLFVIIVILLVYHLFIYRNPKSMKNGLGEEIWSAQELNPSKVTCAILSVKRFVTWMVYFLKSKIMNWFCTLICLCMTGLNFYRCYRCYRILLDDM